MNKSIIKNNYDLENNHKYKKNRAKKFFSILLIFFCVILIILSITLGIKFGHHKSDHEIVESKKILTKLITNDKVNFAKNSLLSNYGNDISKLTINDKFDLNSLKVISLNLSYYNETAFPILTGKMIYDLIMANQSTDMSDILDNLPKRILYATWLHVLNQNHLYLMEAVDSIRTNNPSNSNISLSTIFLYDAKQKAIYFLDFDKFNGININYIGDTYSDANMNLNNFFDFAYNQLFPLPSILADYPNPLVNLKLQSLPSKLKYNDKLSISGTFNVNFAKNIAEDNSKYTASNANKLYGVIPISKQFKNNYALTNINVNDVSSPIKAWIDMNNYFSYFFNPDVDIPRHIWDGYICNDSVSDRIDKFTKTNGAQYLPNFDSINENEYVYKMSKINFQNGGIFAKHSFHNLSIINPTPKFTFMSDILNYHDKFVPKLNIVFKNNSQIVPLTDNLTKIAKYFIANAVANSNKNAINNKQLLQNALKISNNDDNNKYYYNPGLINLKYNDNDNPASFAMGVAINDGSDDFYTKAKEQIIQISNNLQNPYFNAKFYNHVIKMKNDDVSPNNNYGMAKQLINPNNNLIIDPHEFVTGYVPISIFGPLGRNFFEINIMNNSGTTNFDDVDWTIV